MHIIMLKYRPKENVHGMFKAPAGSTDCGLLHGLPKRNRAARRGLCGAEKGGNFSVNDLFDCGNLYKDACRD